MKRKINLTTVVTSLAVLLVPAISLTVTTILPAARAQSQNSGRCSEAMVKGSYAIQLTGWYGIGANRVPYASAGTFVADGNGYLQGNDVVVLDGAAPVPRTVTATYTVDPNTCSGTATSPAAGTFNFFILDNGKEILNISTTPGTTITGVSKRQF